MTAAAAAPAYGSLSAALLLALAEEQAGLRISLPRLCKGLQQSASVLLRELTLMGDARIGPHAGPGWVVVEQEGERWMVRLTAAGAAAAAAIDLRQA